MTRQVTDQLYIDLDYYYPEEYYVYIAEAESAPVVTATLGCEPSKFTGQAAIMSATSTMTVIGQEISDILMQAFADSAVTTTISRFRGIDTEIVSEATVTALANRDQQFSSNMLASTEVAATVTRIKPLSADLVSESFFSVDFNGTRDFEAQMTSDSSLSATVTKQRSLEAELTSTAAMSATITRVRPFVSNNIAGVRPRTNATKPAPPYFLEVNPGFTASIWFRKSDTLSASGPIWSTTTVTSAGGLPASLARFEHYSNNGLRLIFVNFGTGSALCSWPNAFVNDTNWHHALLRLSVGAPGQYNWDLWVDGQQQSTITAGSIPLGWNLYTQNVDEVPEGLKLGHTRPGASETGVDTFFEGDLAQIWIGRAPVGQFSPIFFYDGGPLDLGTTGTFGGLLPTPWLYNSTDTPYQNLISYDSPTVFSAEQPLQLPDFTAVASLTGIGFVRVVAEGDWFTEATLQATIGYLVDVPAALTSEFTITPEVNAIFSQNSDMISAATMQTQETRVRDFDSNMFTESQLEIIYQRVRFGDTSMLAESAWTINENRLRFFDSTMLTTTEQTALAGILRDIEADFIGFFSSMTVGDVINLDPALTLVILPENRLLVILPETRTLTIEQG
jgi:hypothetical protein